MGQTGCYSQSLLSPYIPPNVWCESINESEPYCYGDSCVECIDRGCPIERPFCVNFRCVECEEDRNCWEGRTCSPEGKCVGPVLYCNQADDPDSWCEEHEGLRKCNLDEARCAECVIAFDCLNSAKPYCEDGICVECRENEHCPLGTKCDINKCIEGCDDDLRCPPDRRHCSQKTGKCEECWNPSHCPEGYDCDDYHCVWEGCDGDDNKCPKGQWCSGNNCIEGCRDDANCPDGRPHCSQKTGECEECLVDPHCEDNYICYNYECIHEAETPEEHPEECEYPGDCGDNWICIYGKCYEGCIGDTWCGPGTPKCSRESTQTIWREEGLGTTYGQCVECTSPEHCDEGYICHQGSCQPDIPEAEWECAVDAECAMGVCEGFKCVECRGPENCPLGWSCDNNICIKGCKGPEECPGDKPICSGALGYCVECTGAPHCPDGFKCDNYRCVWSGCEGNDNLCPLGYYCDVSDCVTGCRDNGNCPPGRPHCSQATGMCETCISNPHCPDGYDCVDYHCVWVGISCGGDDSKCPKGEWCPDNVCVEGCNDDSNCPDGRTHCSQATGKCEECYSTVHCSLTQDCVNYHCEERVAVCVDKYDCGFGERCKHGTCIKIECHEKINCNAGEWCDDGVCRPYTDGCGAGCADGYYCNEETNRCEREECKTYRDCDEGECCETITDIKRCVPCDAAKCDALHRCRAGWTCDLSTGLCKPKLCSSPAGCPDGYICDEIAGDCVPIRCTDTTDPDKYCNELFGIGWKCDIDSKTCMRVTCDLADDPDAYCHEYYGPTYACKGNKCIELGFYGYASPDEYCKAYKGKYWRWDFASETCEITPCNLYDDPNGMCADYKGEWYVCIDGKCDKIGEGYPCNVSPQCGPGLRCKYGFCHEIECKESWDCTGENERCVNGLCIATIRDCDVPGDCDPSYFCNKEGRCEKRVCESNIDCPLDYCCLYPYGRGLNVATECVPCGEGFCSDVEDCPLGWECNLETGKCERKLCDSPAECGPGYDCVHGSCVAFNCSTAEDPLTFCQKWWGEYTYCNLATARCEERKCNDYPHPRDVCEEQLGEKFKCDWSTGECRHKESSDFDNPDLYCQKMNGNEWWYWDTELGECRLPTKCGTVNNPDAFCEDIHGPGYRCVFDKCKRGKEGDECQIPEDCAPGFACGDEGICIKKECYIDYDCTRGEWCDKGICKDDDNICVDDNECRDGWFCNPDTGRCDQSECKTHEACDGECCFDGWCIPCEECPCEPGSCPSGWECVLGYCAQRECEEDFQCPKGFRCDRNSGMCVVEESSELIRKCLHDSDCEPGEVCVGAYSGFGIPDPWYGPPWVTEWGRCAQPDRKLVEIKGVIDDKTCDYCLDKIGRIFYLDEATLPKYHDNCRCWADIL